MTKKSDSRKNRQEKALATKRVEQHIATNAGENRGTSAIINQSASTYSGPIPPPQDFLQYNEILPGAADRILSMAEAFGEYERDITSRALALDESIEKSNSKSKTRGQWMSFVLLLLFSGMALAGALLGHPEVFKLFSGTSLAALALIVAAFVGDRIGQPQSKRQAKLPDDDENGQ